MNIYAKPRTNPMICDSNNTPRTNGAYLRNVNILNIKLYLKIHAIYNSTYNIKYLDIN